MRTVIGLAINTQSIITEKRKNENVKKGAETEPNQSAKSYGLSDTRQKNKALTSEAKPSY